MADLQLARDGLEDRVVRPFGDAQHADLVDEGEGPESRDALGEDRGTVLCEALERLAVQARAVVATAMAATSFSRGPQRLVPAPRVDHALV